MKKRLIAVINIKNNLVVQSYGYKHYLPLGSIESFIPNFDRWGVDEILVNDLNRSKNETGPNIKLLNRISNLKINTPIIYSGNIDNETDAQKAIQNGADRIVLGNIFFKNPEKIVDISKTIGTQAIILSVCFELKKNQLLIYNYIKKKLYEFSDEDFIKLQSYISEFLIIDNINEGYEKSFNMKILNKICKKNFMKSLIVFGGISSSNQINKIIKNKSVVAVGIGNFLSYKELAYQKILSKLKKNNFRNPYYEIK